MLFTFYNLIWFLELQITFPEYLLPSPQPGPVLNKKTSLWSAIKLSQQYRHVILVSRCFALTGVN